MTFLLLVQMLWATEPEYRSLVGAKVTELSYRSHAIHYSTYVISSRLTFNTASQFVLLCMTSITNVCRKISQTYFLNLHKCIAMILGFQRLVDFALNIPGQISRNIHFLDLVQEFGTVFLKESEYFLNTNVKFLCISSVYIFWNWRILMLTHLL